ncbi:MAG TPA: hypothetical protein VG738_04465 [Chitinophagaceae bacterium]|nr:hypothetical protein [Chitinophagaceae bacterium]
MESSKKVDHSSVKLGKLSPRHDPRTLQFANYIKSDEMPAPPVKFDWGAKVNTWGMMKNDTVGDCTCAAAGHLIMDWTANVGKMIRPADTDIIRAYSAVTGYDPKTHTNDNGAVETDVLNYWRKKGIARHKIMAYAALEPKNHTHVKQSVYIFGGCYIGLALPVSAQKQKVWSVPPGGTTGKGAPGSWGGHAVPVVAYNDQTLTVVTWGALQQMTWSFWDTYCEESYAIISKDFTKKNKTPGGFDMAALQKDLTEIQH